MILMHRCLNRSARKMRTIITREDALANELNKQALETGKPFKQVVNETLLAGLRCQMRPYRLKPATLGAPALWCQSRQGAAIVG
jgi:hypothetical protein